MVSLVRIKRFLSRLKHLHITVNMHKKLVKPAIVKTAIKNKSPRIVSEKPKLAISKIDDFFGSADAKWDWEKFQSTQGFPVSEELMDWIIGQERAITECKLCIDEWIAKLLYLKKKEWWKAFENPMGHKPQSKEMLPAGPFLLMLGDAGTGKSLLGRAMTNYMTEIYKKNGIKLTDIVAWKNPSIPQEPKISIHPTPTGKEIIMKATKAVKKKSFFSRWGLKLVQGFMIGLGLVLTFISFYWIFAPWITNADFSFGQSIQEYYGGNFMSYLMSTLPPLAPLLGIGVTMMFSGIFIGIIGKMMGNVGNNQEGIGGASSSKAPKLLVDNSSERAPFIDACLLPETMVWMNYTLRNDYKIGEPILNREGYSQKITNVERKQWSGKVVRIKPRLLPETIITENHPILTQNHGWIQAKELQSNDILIIQLPKSINYEIPEDLAWLFGFYLAEGYVKKEGFNWNSKKHGEHWAREIGFTLGFHERELAEQTKILFKKYYNYELKEDLHNSREIQLICYSANLNRFFRNSFGESAFLKHIPKDVFMWNKKGKRAFLKGYWDGDRISPKHNGYATASKQLFYDLIALHLFLGEIPSTHIRTCKGGFIRGRKISSSIQYSMIINNKEKAHYKQSTNTLLLPVRKVSIEDYIGEIVNLETKDGIVPLPFISHNTGHGSSQLFGSIAWDPYQTGGLGTPEHQRCTAGDVHRAHLGILFIDEIKNLIGMEAITLLTVLEDGQLPIALRSQYHGGDTAAMAVASEPVPCMFFLVAAGNLDSLKQIHPALLDRIYGYGKVVYMNNEMSATPENRRKYIQFMAQEIKRFNLLPFSRDACVAVIEEAARRSGRNDQLTCKFRPMIGAIKTASVLARNEKCELVERKHVDEALSEHCKSIGLQVTEKLIERIKVYSHIDPKTKPKIGQIHGLAVSSINAESNDYVGSVLAIRASCVPKTGKRGEGYFHVTGVQTKDSSYVQHSISKVEHVINQLFNINLEHDFMTHVDFAQDHNVEGPSAGITMTLALISCLSKRRIYQNVAVTGEINIGCGGIGEDTIVITPIGGAHEKIMAAQNMGFREVCIPKRNFEKNINPKDYKIKVTSCETIEDYTKVCFVTENDKTNRKT